MIKKSPNSLDTEDLLKLLDEKEEIVETIEIVGGNYENDALTFLSVFDIQPGEDSIKTTMLFSIYKVWSKNPLFRKEFQLEMRNFLPVTKIGASDGYKVNQNVIKLTHEAYSKFKAERHKLRSKHWTKHFEDFLEAYSLKSEQFWIEAPILYFIYDKYAHNLGIDKSIKTYMGKEVFYAYADLFLKYKKTKDGKIYAVSENIQEQFQDGQLARMRISHKLDEKKKTKSTKRGRKPRITTKVQSEK